MFLEVKTKSLKKRKHNREIIRKFLNTNVFDYAIAVFTQEGEQEWKFSFITNTKQEKGDFKTFSYLVGHSNLRTLTERLEKFKSSKRKDLMDEMYNIQDVINIFDIETLNKSFYKELQKWNAGAMDELKIDFTNAIKLLNKTQHELQQQAVIRIIIRMMFIWFMKEKDGLISDEFFKIEFVKDFLIKEDVYYNAVLQNLFFGVLNRSNEDGRGFRPSDDNDAYNTDKNERGNYTLFRYRKYFKEGKSQDFLDKIKQIPFVNGGLFTCHDDAINKNNKDETYRLDGFSDNIKEQAHLKDETIFKLIKLFNSFNFTIEESTPLDKTVALDPELLGTIFENLIGEINPETSDNARKSSGSYYTPKEIVEYMCKESLKEILKNKLPNLKPERLEILIENDNDDFNYPEANEIKSTITSLKILDPACGSGAFPMGMFNLMVRTLEKLTKEKEIYKHKLDIIKNCIYGVDIQPIAVEISKLRFFISLLCDAEVDKTKPNYGIEPLPNLETKFAIANSLVGLKFNIDDEKDVKQRSGDMFKSDARKKCEEIKETFIPYTNAKTRKDKEEIKKQFKKEKKNLVEILKGIGTEGDKNIEYIEQWDPFNIAKHTPFFEPLIMFGESAFDVVIGNPPYIGEKGHSDIFRPLKETKLGKIYYQGKMDLFYFFFHLGLDLLKDNVGILSFVTTNYYITAMGASKLRERFKKKQILKLINFNEFKVFQSALGQHNMITIIQNTNTNKDCDCVIATKETSIYEIFSNTYKISNLELYDGKEENYIRMQKTNNMQKDVLNKIMYCNVNTGIQSSGDNVSNKILNEICNVNQGIISSGDNVSNKILNEICNVNQGIISSGEIKLGDGIFVLDKNNSRDNKLIQEILESNEKDLLKPFYKNSDISRYKINKTNNLYILYIDRNTELNPSYPIYKHLSKFQCFLQNRREFIDGKRSFYQLHRSREKIIFEGEKIVIPQRNKNNVFALQSGNWWSASADVYFITLKNATSCNNYNLKYILGLLNSKLYLFWLKNKCKVKGEMLELCQIPLSEIPILEANKEQQEKIINIVKQIISDKEQGKDTIKQEREIDDIVYKMYGLTAEQIAMVEGK